MHRQVFELKTKIVRPKHSDTHTSIHNIAFKLYEQSQYIEAEALIP
jgi:hypothetical protein